MMKRRSSIAIKLGAAAIVTLMAACTPPPETSSKTTKQKIGRPYQIGGNWYYPRAEKEYDQVGIASWYGEKFHGAPTANGEIFDMNEISAAHTTLPLPSWVEVTNLGNNQSIVVRINDRGPFVDGRLIDLSKATAKELGFLKTGVARVRVRLVDPPEGAVIAKAPPKTEPDNVEVASLAPVTIPEKSPEAVPTAEAESVVPGGGDSIVQPVRKPVRNLPTQSITAAPGQVQRPYRKPSTSEAVSASSVSTTASAPTSSNTSGRYMVQVATFSSADNAKRLASRFDRTYSPGLSSYSLEDGRVLNRVRLGPFETRIEAEAALKAAVDKGLNDARIFLQRG